MHLIHQHYKVEPDFTHSALNDYASLKKYLALGSYLHPIPD